jgi:predicted nucleic-acid-binding protein
MIGIDTNILVRLLVKDDEKQTSLAANYIKNNCVNSKAIINHVVLCELVWVLESAYKYERVDIVDAIEHILRTKQFLVLEKESVRSALELYENNKLDFSDALIGYINIDSDSNCKTNLTFDKEAAKTDIYTLLK